MRPIHSLIIMCALLPSPFAGATDPEAKKLIEKAVAAAGGEASLLRLFRIKERLNIGSDESKVGNERVSVLEPPKYWWVGKKERVKESAEPATFLVWAWTLGALTDTHSEVSVISEIAEQEKPAFGLRISETITPPMELYFDQGNSRLLRIDWRDNIHRFSDWKELDGVDYPAKCVGYKKKSGKAWYFTEIIELQRLTELPDGLQR